MPTAEKEALSAGEIEKRLADLPNWKRDNDSLLRAQKFPTYKDALDFVYQVGLAAEAEDHHPDITMKFKNVEVRYSTHTAGGITGLDFKMAKRVEVLVDKFNRPISPR